MDECGPRNLFHNHPRILSTMEELIRSGRIPSVQIIDEYGDIKPIKFYDENNNVTTHNVEKESPTTGNGTAAVKFQKQVSIQDGSIDNSSDSGYPSAQYLHRRSSYYSRDNVPFKVRVIRGVFLATILIAGFVLLLFPPFYHWRIVRHQNSGS